jgi:hypothetical protein
MSVSSEFDARIEMKAFIDRSQAAYADWYVGIAADPEERLTNEHGVQESDWWIVRQLASAEAARRIEEALLKMGCAGGPGGGDESTTAVYAYWKREHTTP